MAIQPPDEAVKQLEREAVADDAVPTNEEWLLMLRESMKQALAGETMPVEELIEEVRRERSNCPPISLAGRGPRAIKYDAKVNSS